MFPSRLLMPAVIALCACVSCQDIPKHPSVTKGGSDSPVVKKDSPVAKKDTAFPLNPAELYGHRFTIKGDFDGDGKKETLVEHYYSGITNKESNKYYRGAVDYGDDVDSSNRNKTVTFISSNNPKIPQLNIGDTGRTFGLVFLRNEGDLDGDGADEISYVINYTDWSTLNGYDIMTLKNHRWKELYYFPIWEWQIKGYGWGDSAYHTLDHFKGLVKKLATNKIQITYRTDDAEMADTVIDLRHPNKW